MLFTVSRIFSGSGCGIFLPWRSNTLLVTVFVVALVLSIRVAPAQSLRFDQLTVSDGLASNSIYSILEDSHGILWFGSLDGLHYYDGYQITVFKHDHAVEGSLPHNRVTAIYEDTHRYLWLYDEFTGSITKYDPALERFQAYYLNQIAGAPLDESSMSEGADGMLYVESSRGYTLRYNSKADTFELLRTSTRHSLTLQDTVPDLWRAFDRYLRTCGRLVTANSVGVRKVFKDSGGRYWISTRYDGLYTAVATAGRYDFISHLYTNDPRVRIESQDIHDVYEDHSGVVWIGTKNNGLFRFSRYKYKFEYIESIETPTGVTRLGPVRAIAQDAQHNTWIGTNDQGLIRIDPSFRTGKSYVPDSADRFSVGHRFIRSLRVDEKNRVWVGHYNGFSLYQPRTDNFRTFTPRSGTPEDVRVYDIKEDQRGGMWMASWDLILHVDSTLTQYDFISRSLSGTGGFASENIRELELDDAGGLWIAAGEKGLTLYSREEGRFTTVHYSPSDSTGLPSDNLFDVFKDQSNRLWLATADGLCLFDPVKRLGTTFTINDRLASNLIYGILQDQQGFLWLSSTKGLSKFNPVTHECRNYDDEDGLQSNEFTENAFFKNADGVMFFGGVNGLNWFHPEHVLNSPVPPRVMITTVRVFNTSLWQVRTMTRAEINQRMLHGEEIVFAPDQRSVSFDFVGMHYVNPKKNGYAYMLEGFERKWTFRDANVRFANYTNLGPGDYVFKVKSCNSDGVWSEPVALKFSIQTPFYSAYWFIATCAVMLIVMGVFGYRWRIAVVKRQQGMKANQLESELNFLKSQVNPHFLFNSLNNIYALCQVSSRNAAPMVGKLSEMMRYMIYDCNAATVPLSREVEYLQNYIDLHQLKSNRKLNAWIRINGHVEGLNIAPLLLINFLENSFKHGDVGQNGGFAHMIIACGEGELTVSVKNSYHEWERPAGRKPGIGLENVRHRLNLIYPRKYTLDIRRNGGIFEVVLRIKMV